ncbi:GNAT family N-acetyltransferase [soil metagenome]
MLACRLLGDADLPAVRALLAADPVAGCLVATRVERGSLDPRRLGGELWGHGEDRLDGVCLSGPNLVPLARNPAALSAFAHQALQQGRRCSSIVGLQPAVEVLWAALAEAWGPARELRPFQPLMSLPTAPRLRPDQGVRAVRLGELDLLLPACVAMFTEEIGQSPLGNDGGRSYRARVRDLIVGGRAFARFEDGEVVFKAELGALSSGAAQIQGVWVAPHRRGEGLAAAGVAAVAAIAVPRMAPQVSLYVNQHNEPALRAYRRVGFEQVGTFMTVLF